MIASVFALAGGANGVAYPARTLYQNKLATPGRAARRHRRLKRRMRAAPSRRSRPLQLHARDGGRKLRREARSACAGTGYDGPSGLGTPTGSPASTRRAKTKPRGEEALQPRRTGSADRPPKKKRLARKRTEPADPRPRAPPAPAGGGRLRCDADSSAGDHRERQPGVELSALTLTRAALIALNRSRPKISQVGFQFTLNAHRAGARDARQAHPLTRAQQLVAAASLADASPRPAAHDNRRLGGRTRARCRRLPADAHARARRRRAHSCSDRLAARPARAAPGRRTRAERRRQLDGAVRLLAVLEQRDDRAPDGDGGAVERVQRLRALCPRACGCSGAAPGSRSCSSTRSARGSGPGSAATPRSRTSSPPSCRGRRRRC